MRRHIITKSFVTLCMLAALMIIAPPQGFSQDAPFSGTFTGDYFGMTIELTLEDTGDGQREGIVRIIDADGNVVAEFLAEAQIEILLLVPDANFEDTAVLNSDGSAHFSLLGHMAAHHDDADDHADHDADADTDADHDADADAGHDDEHADADADHDDDHTDADADADHDDDAEDDHQHEG